MKQQFLSSTLFSDNLLLNIIKNSPTIKLFIIDRPKTENISIESIKEIITDHLHIVITSAHIGKDIYNYFNQNIGYRVFLCDENGNEKEEIISHIDFYDDVFKFASILSTIKENEWICIENKKNTTEKIIINFNLIKLFLDYDKAGYLCTFPNDSVCKSLIILGGTNKNCILELEKTRKFTDQFNIIETQIIKIAKQNSFKILKIDLLNNKIKIIPA